MMTSGDWESTRASIRDCDALLQTAVEQHRIDDAIVLSQKRHRLLQCLFSMPVDEENHRKCIEELLAANHTMEQDLSIMKNQTCESIKVLDQGARARRAYNG